MKNPPGFREGISAHTPRYVACALRKYENRREHVRASMHVCRLCVNTTGVGRGRARSPDAADPLLVDMFPLVLVNESGDEGD
jgi:hypothetical protein